MSSHDHPGRRQVLLGIASMVAAVAVFSGMDALIKKLAGDYPTVQIVFFRNLFAFIPLAIFLAATGTRLASLRTRRLGGHMLRAVYGFVAMMLFFYCFGVMPLVDVIAIGFAAPIFMTALSVLLLREQVGVHRWSAVIVGFLGVLVMVRPGQSGFGLAALLALLATLAYALAIIQVRVLSRTEPASSIVFYVSLFAVLASGLLLPFYWRTPDPAGFLLLAATGVLGGVGQILITTAFRLAPISIVAPFDYTALIWGGMLGWIFWGEVPQAATLAGAAIVIASGLYILHRETRRARLPAPVGAQ